MSVLRIEVDLNNDAFFDEDASLSEVARILRLLATKIEGQGFMDGHHIQDVNGNTVTPLGPKYWGGSADALDYVVTDLHWGVSGGYNLTDELNYSQGFGNRATPGPGRYVTLTLGATF